MLLINEVRLFLTFYVVRIESRNIAAWITTLQSRLDTSDINVGTKNHLLHTDKGAYLTLEL